jgi:cytidine deaminase
MIAPELVAAAEAVAAQAYVPYCEFPVGAALRADDGRVFVGANVDNASSPLTVCAERSAVSAAVSAGARRIVEVAVHGSAPSVSPCGGCRQVLAEFAAPGCVVSFLWEGKRIEVPLRELLPYGFALQA